MYDDTDEIIAKIKAKDSKIANAKQMLEIAISLGEANVAANEKHREDIQAQYKAIATKVDAEFTERSVYITKFTEALRNVLANLKDEPVKEGGDILTDQMVTAEPPLVTGKKKGIFRS